MKIARVYPPNGASIVFKNICNEQAGVKGVTFYYLAESGCWARAVFFQSQISGFSIEDTDNREDPNVTKEEVNAEPIQ